MTKWGSFTKRELMDILKDHGMDDTIQINVRCGNNIVSGLGWDLIPHRGSGPKNELVFDIDTNLWSMHRK